MDFIKMMIEALTETDKGSYKEVGKVSPELLKRYRDVNRKSDRINDEIKLLIIQTKMELEMKIEDKYGEEKEQLKDERMQLWDEIAVFLGVSNDDNLKINTSTGIVSKKEEASIDDIFKGIKRPDMH